MQTATKYFDKSEEAVQRATLETTGNRVVPELSSSSERDSRERLMRLFQDSPLPDSELLRNLGLYTNRQLLSRIFHFGEVYRQIIDVPGIIMEFGTRWGHNLALFHSFRGMWEPFNYSRKIVGFDTFEGFPSVAKEDGTAAGVHKGSLAVPRGYQNHLQRLLEYHESESPLSHIRRFELVKGDASKTVPQYLKDHPETIIAFAYFDMDIYDPTKACLEAIRPYLTKGSIVGFDELNYQNFPGETQALREALGLDRIRLRRTQLDPLSTYFIVE